MSATNSEIAALVKKLLELTSVSALPVSTVSEKELVDLAVKDFANGAVLKGVLLRLPGMHLGPFGAIPGFDLDNASMQVNTHVPDDEHAQVHKQFCADLDAVVSGQVTPEMLERISGASRTVLIETPIMRGKKPEISKRYFPTSLPTALAYVLIRLITAGIGKNSDLRRCNLGSCRRFFFSSEESGSGAPLTMYCRGHGEKYRESTARERVEASRLGLPLAEWRALKSFDSEMTPQKWKSIKAKHARISPKKWIENQRLETSK